MRTPNLIWDQRITVATDAKYWPVWENQMHTSFNGGAEVDPQTREPYEPGDRVGRFTEMDVDDVVHPTNIKPASSYGTVR
jgi:hypothetical protein